jgi:hypothetical protein
MPHAGTTVRVLTQLDDESLIWIAVELRAALGLSV